jgi:hypothetical protein
VPARDASYGELVWQTLAPRLGTEPRPSSLGWAPWRSWAGRAALAGAVAAIVAAAFLVGRWSALQPNSVPGQSTTTTIVATTAQPVRERVLLVAVGDHLERSQMVLLELTHTQPAASVDISSEQHWARDLIDSNRLYRQAALRDGDPGIASVLDELERQLLEIANSPSKMSSASFQRLRKHIESEGIVFKVRVVGSQLENRMQQQREQPETALPAPATS